MNEAVSSKCFLQRDLTQNVKYIWKCNQMHVIDEEMALLSLCGNRVQLILHSKCKDNTISFTNIKR